MPLDPSVLSIQLASAFLNAQPGEPSKDAVDRITSLADDIASAIDAYIRLGTVNTTVLVSPGQITTTPAGPGVTSSPGQGVGTGVMS